MAVAWVVRVFVSPHDVGVISQRTAEKVIVEYLQHQLEREVFVGALVQLEIGLVPSLQCLLLHPDRTVDAFLVQVCKTLPKQANGTIDEVAAMVASGLQCWSTGVRTSRIAQIRMLVHGWDGLPPMISHARDAHSAVVGYKVSRRHDWQLI